MAFDWAIHTNTKALFLQLDFEKAFDRVNLNYIWANLSEMGLGGIFLQLMKGLILGGTVKIHINGQFFEDIILSRGVCQGCPLSPLLFAISMQPLLAYIQGERQHGRMVGLQISPSLQICERLFANDVGILILATKSHFQEVEECIHLYERAFGAKLNLRKSLALPIGFSVISSWLQAKGCIFYKPGEISRYLGAPIGYQVQQSKLLDYCLNYVSKRIASWKGKHVSFPRCIILIRKILSAILVYHMMYMRLSKTAAHKLQQLFKDLLWGFAKNGRCKMPLIAWERITRPKKQGGLDIRLSYFQGVALLARWASHIISNPTFEWTTLFLTIILAFKWCHSRTLRRNGYTLKDKLLFGQPLSFVGCHYIAGLWQAWAHLRSLLTFNFSQGYILAR